MGFNKEWAKKAGKKRFISHFKLIYPLLDLSDEFDKIVPPRPKKAKQK